MVLDGAMAARGLATATPRAEVSKSARPFLKWAGGKQQLVPALLEGTPPAFGRYFEPFLGGGALFFALAGRRRLDGAVLCDANADLIATYEAVRDDRGGLVRRLRGM